MNLYIDNNIDQVLLESLFVEAFAELKDEDENKFTSENSLAFRDWFGIDSLKDYLKYSQIIIAEEKGKLIGAAIVGQQNPLTFPDGRKFELFILGVISQYRKMGVGKKLMIEAESIAKQLGGKSVIINTNSLMESTIHFYVNCGYKNIGVLKDYYDNSDATFLLKHL